MPKIIHRKFKRQYIIYSIFPVALLVPTLLLCTFSSGFAHAEGFTYNVRIQPSLNVSVSTNRLSLLLNPGSNPFNTGDLDITVATNNANGYKLYMNADDTRLANHTYSETAYIPTLTSSATEANFPTDTWGYQISSGDTGDSNVTSITDFYPFTSGTLVSSSSTNTEGTTSTLTFAAKAGYSKPSGSYLLDLSFKALPIITTYDMQNLDPEVCTTEPTIVTDNRDGQTYAIGRAADGKCWMLQNLKLGKTEDNIALTSADSNVDANGFTLSANEAGVEGVFPYVARDDANPVAYVKDKSEYYCTDDYGCYYNWYTATAGSGKGEGSSATAAGVSVQYSICPAGWTLPTGGENGDFGKLAEGYGYGVKDVVEVVSDMFVADPSTATENVNGVYNPGFLLSGGYYTYGATMLHESGTYWSSSASADLMSYKFTIKPTNLYLSTNYDRYRGFAVRCLLQES